MAARTRRAPRTRKAAQVTFTFAPLTVTLPSWIERSDDLMDILRKAPAARTADEREQIEELFAEHFEREGLAPDFTGITLNK